jgi:C2 domain
VFDVAEASAAADGAKRKKTSVGGGSKSRREEGVEYLQALRASGILKVILVQGIDLSAKDLNGFSDPYCVFRLGDQKSKSRTRKKTLNPVWNEALMLNLVSSAELLHVTVYDHDKIGKNAKMVGLLLWVVYICVCVCVCGCDIFCQQCISLHLTCSLTQALTQHTLTHSHSHTPIHTQNYP